MKEIAIGYSEACKNIHTPEGNVYNKYVTDTIKWRHTFTVAGLYSNLKTAEGKFHYVYEQTLLLNE